MDEKMTMEITNDRLEDAIKQYVAERTKENLTTVLNLLIACIAVAITIHFLSKENALNVINDVIALISLGISIEDEKISNFFKTRAPI